MAVNAAYEIVILNFYAAVNSSDDAATLLLNALQINSEIILVGFWIRLGVFLLSLCVMLASSCAVVLYLWRHMKNVEDSGLVSPRLQRQIKMTITGITVQALLHLLCSDGVIIFQIILQYTDMDVDWNGNILCTIISLYSFGTTVNMMIDPLLAVRLRELELEIKIQEHEAEALCLKAVQVSTERDLELRRLSLAGDKPVPLPWTTASWLSHPLPLALKQLLPTSAQVPLSRTANSHK
ncbi:hypothetical protein MHYP_G00061660 [Metynnis hypsauchen]